MGLGTSHDCWHGPYLAFHNWRNSVAVAAGYSLTHSSQPGIRIVDVDWGVYGRHIQGEWDHEEADPVMYLVAHSDCDGVIHPAQAGPLADRLEALLPKLDDDGTRWGDRARALKFIAGLRAAVAAGEDVDFH